MDAVNRETLNQYFDLLKDALTEHNLLQSPLQIYNVDESGISLDPKAPNVVAKKGTKKVRYRTSGKKGQITVVGCVNAAGQVLPPMIIFDAKNLNHAWTKNEVPGTKYGLSDKGWINTELFEGWFTELFLPCAVSARPLLLLLDGHSTHYQPDVVRFAQEHDVIMLCLPPHTSHEMQPLDCDVFGPLKCHWSNTCHDFYQNNPGKVVTKFNFNTLFSQAWLKAVSPINVISGFKTCGMHPYNSDAIKVPGDSLKPMSSAAPRTDAISNATSPTAPHTDAISNASSPEQVCDTRKFTEEQLQLFEKRAEEGYNLYTDPAYVSWLKRYHPELLPSDRYSLVSVDTPEADSSEHELSVLQHFSAVVPESPLTVEGVTPPSVTQTQIASASTTPLHISSPDTAPNCVTPTVTTPHLTSSTLDPVSIADDTPHHISPSVATPQSSSASTTPYQVCLLEQIPAESLLLVLLQTLSLQPVQNQIRLVIVHQKLARLYQNTWLDPQTLPLRREVSHELDC